MADAATVVSVEAADRRQRRAAQRWQGHASRACAERAPAQRAAPARPLTARAAAGVRAPGQVPEFEELKACIKAIKDANPDMGISKVHKTVKEQNPTWQVFFSSDVSAALACGRRWRRLGLLA